MRAVPVRLWRVSRRVDIRASFVDQVGEHPRQPHAMVQPTWPWPVL